MSGVNHSKATIKRLSKKILRKLWYERRKREYMLHHYLPIMPSLKTFVPEQVDLDDSLRTLPGNPVMFPWLSAESAAFWKQARFKELVIEHVMHYLRIFSSKPLDLSSPRKEHSETFLKLTDELPQELVGRYAPIHWHKDFRAGSEWPKRLWYFDPRLAPKRGKDIKIPWELSRFVHVGALVHGDYEAGAYEFMLQALDWIADNPRYFGVNWASELVVAVRAINWIWGLSLFKPVLKRYPQTLKTIASSLYDHRIYLQRNLAYHELYSNDHYIGDLVGILYICAAFPEFPLSDEWCLFALNGIHSEMNRQVFVDGCSQMMSTHYHRFVTEIFMSGAVLAERMPIVRKERMRLKMPASAWPYVTYDKEPAVNLNEGKQVFSAKFYDQLQKMAYFTAALTKPNGLVPQFGDNDSARIHRFWPDPKQDVRDHRHLLAAVGELLNNKELAKIGGQHSYEARLICGGVRVNTTSKEPPYDLKAGCVFFSNAQIAVFRYKQVYLAVTCSPNGYPNGRGGQGHNDKLSFELNIYGQDFIVDGGCPYYTSDPGLRNAYRATAAHSTLIVPGKEQDPIPTSLFLLPEYCKPRLHVESEGLVVGSHEGYGTIHLRCFELRDNKLCIEDTFASDEPRYLNFNLDPTVSVEIGDMNDEIATVYLQKEDNILIQLTLSGARRIEVKEGRFGIGYGLPRNNRRILVHLSPNIKKTRTYLKFSS